MFNKIVVLEQTPTVCESLAAVLFVVAMLFVILFVLCFVSMMAIEIASRLVNSIFIRLDKRKAVQGKLTNLVERIKA
jgi:Skp family chaperone for outer membrane proteins